MQANLRKVEGGVVIDRWEQFNLIIDDESLDVKEKGLLLILFRYVNYKTGYADPSRELLKKLYGTKKMMY